MPRKDKKKPNLRVVPPAPAAEVLWLDCYFEDFDGALPYPIRPSDWDRIHMVLGGSGKEILAVETLDGRQVFLSLRHLQSCRLAPGELERAAKLPDALVCHLLGTGTLEIADVDRDGLGYIKMVMTETADLDERFVLIPEQAGTTTAINMGEIVFLEFPTAWLAEDS